MTHWTNDSALQRLWFFNIKRQKEELIGGTWKARSGRVPNRDLPLTPCVRLLLRMLVTIYRTGQPEDTHLSSDVQGFIRVLYLGVSVWLINKWTQLSAPLCCQREHLMAQRLNILITWSGFPKWWAPNMNRLVTMNYEKTEQHGTLWPTMIKQTFQ